MSNLLSWQFWFDPTPVVMSNTFMWGFFAVFAALVLGSLAARIYVKSTGLAKDVRGLGMNAANAAMIAGLAGFVWLFFTYEEVQFFAYRIWVVVIAAVLVGYFISLYRFARTELPKKAQRALERENLQKYLPRRSR
ncbi:hypothetical protein KBC55_04405 [Patescibacteria group bacterium]|nr:hypothetical protein [Patescibacteria group bacterium]